MTDKHTEFCFHGSVEEDDKGEKAHTKGWHEVFHVRGDTRERTSRCLKINAVTCFVSLGKNKSNIVI